MTATGIRLVGRLAGIRDGRAQFSGSLRNVCDLADLKMNRLLDGIDDWISRAGHGAEPAPLERPRPTRMPRESCLGLDLVDAGFGTTDVLIILPVDRINPRYVRYYGPNADRHAS